MSEYCQFAEISVCKLLFIDLSRKDVPCHHAMSWSTVKLSTRNGTYMLIECLVSG